MRSADFNAIVSPVMHGALKRAKGGRTHRPKSTSLTVIIPLNGPQVVGALGRLALALRARRMGRPL